MCRSGVAECRRVSCVEVAWIRVSQYRIEWEFGIGGMRLVDDLQAFKTECYKQIAKKASPRPGVLAGHFQSELAIPVVMTELTRILDLLVYLWDFEERCQILRKREEYVVERSRRTQL